MVSRRLSRAVLLFALAVTTLMFIAISFDAQAQRFGGMRSFGRQSSNIMKQRQAVKPPAAASSSRQQQGSSAASTRQQAGAQNAAARSGFSRFLGPIAGIAAGLGIAALLSSLGLSGAFLELISSLVLILAVVFIARWLFRVLRGGAAQPLGATRGNHSGGGSYGGHSYRQNHAASGAYGGASSPSPMTIDGQAREVNNTESTEDTSWFIPQDFDVPAFLDNAKKQFAHIQQLWDRGDAQGLQQLLTDDLFKELQPAILANAQSQTNHTEIVLLNAELMGIEKFEDGFLASVRYSGMLREGSHPEATRFEEVWNLLKAEGTGWLVAGIQQMPDHH